jgi:hypothetical protein
LVVRARWWAFLDDAPEDGVVASILKDVERDLREQLEKGRGGGTDAS